MREARSSLKKEGYLLNFKSNSNEDVLYRICKDLYCVVRFYNFRSKEGVGRGHELQDVFQKYCLSQGIELVERRGNLTCFGRKGISGLGHEVDGTVQSDERKILIELKAYTYDVPKHQVMLFNEKSLDFYLAFVKEGKPCPLHRVLISDSSMNTEVRRFCYTWRIIIVEPQILPLPVVLEYSRHPKWEKYFDFPILQEIERVLPKYSVSLDNLLEGQDESLQFLTLRKSALPSLRDLEEIEEIHLSMSEELLQVIEEEDPDHFEIHAEHLLSKADLL
jgi:hypothetical protein